MLVWMEWLADQPMSDNDLRMVTDPYRLRQLAEALADYRNMCETGRFVVKQSIRNGNFARLLELLADDLESANGSAEKPAASGQHEA